MHEEREIPRVSPAQLDRLLAGGWRHFGSLFFRYDLALAPTGIARGWPLRIDVGAFQPSRSQLRVARRNRDVEADFRPATIDADRIALFRRHRVRFTDNVPESLGDFLSDSPATVPCRTLECDLLLDGRLIGVSYLDDGAESASAVFAMFEPEESRRSPGVLMILRELEYARERGKKHLYLGYCYDLPSHYDYKKRFAATERFDWKSSLWTSFSPCDAADATE